MPEIGEVARIVHFIRKHLVGKTLAVVNAQHDEKVFGAVGTSAAEFETKLRGKKVVDAGQQGKYFWLVMSEPPHPLMHFGMAGWFELRHEITSYKKSGKSEDQSIWPPKYCIFALETVEEPKCEAAFVDFRRFGRVRLVDCPAEYIRQVSPLKENGPDPVIDRELVTEEWFTQSLLKKKVRVKTYLLSQENISGVGNWVGDEILYQAAVHPEIYTNTLTSAQISRIYKSLIEVTSLAVETLADDTKFPESWLFKHRWNKGKKEIASTLPNGEKVSYLTVGGRTTAIVASVQKKTDERKEKRDEISESEKEDEVDGEGVMDVEEERAVKRKSRSKGGKKINKKTEALPPESTITEAKHHSEEADRHTNLPTGAKQDEEESQSSEIEETDSADSKTGTPAKKPKREAKPAPDVDQKDEAEPQPNISEPPQSTPTPTTKNANKPKPKPKPKPPTGKEQDEEDIGRLVKVPTRKSTRKSRPLIPIPATTPTMAAPPKPKTKKKRTTDTPPITDVVHHLSSKASSSSSPSKPTPKKRKINPSATGNEEEEEEEEEEEREGEDLAEPSSNTTEKKTVTTTSTNITTTTTTTTTAAANTTTTTGSKKKKIKTTMETNLQPPQEAAGPSSHSHSSIVVAKNEEDEDIWEGRRRSRRVSGRGVSPPVAVGRKSDLI